MRKVYLPLIGLLVYFMMPSIAGAQDCNNDKNYQVETISKFVSNLSVRQRRQMDAISKENAEEVTALKQQLRKVRKSIGVVMSSKGDHTNEIMPLFEQEASLELQLHKLMYQMKVQVDEVLTEEQYQELTTKANQKRKSHHKSPSGK